MKFATFGAVLLALAWSFIHVCSAHTDSFSDLESRDSYPDELTDYLYGEKYVALSSGDSIEDIQRRGKLVESDKLKLRVHFKGSFAVRDVTLSRTGLNLISDLELRMKKYMRKNVNEYLYTEAPYDIRIYPAIGKEPFKGDTAFDQSGISSGSIIWADAVTGMYDGSVTESAESETGSAEWETESEEPKTKNGEGITKSAVRKKPQTNSAGWVERLKAKLMKKKT